MRAIARIFVSGFGLLALAYSNPGSAQSTNGTAASTNSQGLEEVIVTARRREEKAQTVPIALNTFSQETLQYEQINNAYQLADEVPGLTECCSAHFDNKSGDFMRGVKGFQTYIAGVPIPYATSMATPYFDIDNVQILKGPQGTLFGGSTDSGSILYEPKKPTNNYEGYGQLGVGNYNHTEFQAVVNVPIVPDKVLVRVGGVKFDTDGYVYDPSQNKFLNDVHYWDVRATATLRPLDDLENTTMVNYYDFHNNSDQYVIQYFNPHGLAAEVDPGWLAYWLKQIPLGDYSIAPNPIPGSTYALQEQWVLVNTTTWDINDNLSIKNIAGYVDDRLGDDYHALPAGLFLDSAVILPNGQYVSSGSIDGAGGPTVQYTEELQAQGKLFNDRLTYTFGTFNSWYGQRQPRVPEYTTTFFQVSGDASATTERTHAIYAQGTFDLSDWVPGLSFTGGYRYTWDSQQESNLFYGPTTALLATEGFTGSWGGPTYTLSLDYQLDPTTMLYITNSKGFETGGFNSGSGSVGLPSAYLSYNPESLSNVEVGVKSDFDVMGVKSRLNFSGFYGFYDNIQTSLTIAYLNTITHAETVTAVTQNAATGHISGFDGEYTFVPTDGVSVYLGFEYLNDKYDSYPSPLLGNLSDTPFIMTPKWKYVVRGNFRLPGLPSDLGTLSLLPTWTWQSGVITMQELNAPQGDRTGEFGTANASLLWHDVWGQPGLEATFYGTNLLNNKVEVNGLAVYSSLGLTAGVPPPPRMWGVTLKYAFGP
jgi:iron complex outermembrane receptor protein